MLPNKGIRSIDPAHHIEGLVSLVRPKSGNDNLRKMSNTDTKEDSSQSSETDHAQTSAKVEYEDRFLDF
jgi:hypothetical protein